MKTDKYLVTFEFRYTDIKNDDESYQNKKITIGVFDTLEEAYKEGNEALECLEARFELNPNYMKKERFSKNGFLGTPNHLISDLAYLQTPFSFYAKITTLQHLSVSDTIDNVLGAVSRCKEYKTKEDLEY